MIIVVPQSAVWPGGASCSRWARGRDQAWRVEESITRSSSECRIESGRTEDRVTVISKVEVREERPAEPVDDCQAAGQAKSIACIEFGILPSMLANENCVGFRQIDGHVL